MGTAMEKVFDLHVHYTFDIPLEDTLSIFREEFMQTGTDKCCFLSLPHNVENGKVYYDETQNIKGLYLKQNFSPNAYAFAGLVHPTDYADVATVSADFLAQAKEYLSVGFDGVKMLEGYPSLIKARKLPIDSPVFDEFYAFMEANSYPILMHLANPAENWDIAKADRFAIQAGRIYDDTYPTKEELTAQLFRVMEKFPKLKLILAHFGFFSDNIANAERFFRYENTLLDITPGGEQLINMGKQWTLWLPFWEKYQDRILYGTDFYAFPKDENWETAYQRRPRFLRQFLETKQEFLYLDEAFTGVSVDKYIRDKIYRKNFTKLLGAPKPINKNYLVEQAQTLLAVPNKKSNNAQKDLEYILNALYEYGQEIFGHSLIARPKADRI